MQTPKNVRFLHCEVTCVSLRYYEFDKLTKNKTKANKKTRNKLVKEHLPDLYDSLMLSLYNPYDYYKTDKHLILIHSGIEYFLRFEL